jgi:hypothetical protein
MDFLRVWLTGIVKPAQAMEALKPQPAPLWGLAAVLVRFILTSLFVALPLALLRRTPFQPSYLAFIPEESYYLALIFTFPLFGVVTWLLMSGCAHLLLRFSSHHTDFDQVANIVGMSMLIPVPIILAWDLSMILADAYELVTMAPSHSLFQVWETILGIVGFKCVLGLGTRPAVLVAITANLIYVLTGALFSR